MASEMDQCPTTPFKPLANFNPFETKRPVQEGPLRREVPMTEDERRLEFNTFDEVKTKGLPYNYDPVEGWWLERQNEIARSVDPIRFAQLSIEKRKDDFVQNAITEFEALSILQAKRQNLVSGATRPDMKNVDKERKLNLDFNLQDDSRHTLILKDHSSLK